MITKEPECRHANPGPFLWQRLGEPYLSGNIDSNQTGIGGAIHVICKIHDRDCSFVRVIWMSKSRTTCRKTCGSTGSEKRRSGDAWGISCHGCCLQRLSYTIQDGSQWTRTGYVQNAVGTSGKSGDASSISSGK